MSEIEAPGLSSEAVAAEPAAASFGRRLALEREKRGLSVDDVAARLRLHPKQVRAIENESLPALPAPFLRGFVRNYAKELQLDPAPLVAELNARLGPAVGKADGTQPGAAVSAPSAPSDQASRRVVLVGVLGALVVFAVLGWLATRSDEQRDEPAVNPARPVATPAAPAVDPAAVTPKAETVVPPAAEASVPAPAALPSASVPARSAVDADSLRLTFRDQSWVEVTQADGRVVLSQLNEAGTEQRLDAKPPLKLVIGNASSVSVDYKGRAVDLKSATSADNVARLTLD